MKFVFFHNCERGPKNKKESHKSRNERFMKAFMLSLVNSNEEKYGNIKNKLLLATKKKIYKLLGLSTTVQRVFAIVTPK